MSSRPAPSSWLPVLAALVAAAVVSLDARGPAAGAGTLVGLVPADALKALTRKKKKKHGKRTARKDPKPRGAR